MTKFVIDVEEKDIGHIPTVQINIFINLYQASKKGKRKIKTNLFDDSDSNDLTRLDVSNFFKGTRGKSIT